MFNIEWLEQKNPENKTIYVCRLIDKRLKFTNKILLLEYYKDLNNFFREYFFLLETFYYRIKSFEFELSQKSIYGQSTGKLFLDVEEMRANVFIKSEQKKCPDEISKILNSFLSRMMHLCFAVKKKNHIEAENIYHLLTDLQTKFYAVLDSSFELHQNKSLKIFI